MRTTTAALALAALATVPAASRAAEEVPEPRFDRVDHAHPEKCLELPATLGKRASIEKIAAEIHGDTPRAKLFAVGAWVDSHLRYDEKTFDRWRDVDALLADGSYGGCADHAEICGAIARACGIPVVWVKSLDLDWIAWFRVHPDQPKSWSGHVFLEVHLEGKWRLFDASQRLVYDDYDPRQRILPGRRLAYDKGVEPYALVLSPRWELWKEQTRRFVAALDPSLVPVLDAPSAAPGTVYVAARNPAWQWAFDRCKALGLPFGKSGYGDWDQWLPKARTGILIVPSVGGDTVLPEEYRSLLPADAARVREVLRDKPSGVLRKKAADGTDVVYVVARDEKALQAAIEELRLDAR